jgi:hypothetical protein
MQKRRKQDGDKDDSLTGEYHLLDQSRGFQVGPFSGVEHEIGAPKG